MSNNTIGCIAICALIALTGGPVEAQNVDVSGTWILDRNASEFPQRPGGGGGRGGFVGGGPVTVTIAQTDTVLVIEEEAGSQRQTITYRLDGSESENMGPRGGLATTTSSLGGRCARHGGLADAVDASGRRFARDR